MTFLNYPVTTGSKYYVTLWVRPPHPESAPNKVFGAMGLVNVEINVCDFSRDHVIDVSRDFVGGVPLS